MILNKRVYIYCNLPFKDHFFLGKKKKLQALHSLDISDTRETRWDKKLLRKDI